MVSAGGCSGFEYSFDLDKTQNSDDKIFETGGVKVIIDEMSLELLDGSEVDYVDDQDGFQFILQNGYWSLVRLSGTEPIVRIYAESESPKSVEQLLKETRALAGI